MENEINYIKLEYTRNSGEYSILWKSYGDIQFNIDKYATVIAKEICGNLGP